MKKMLCWLLLLVSSVYAQESSFFRQALEGEFTRIDRIGRIDYLSQDDADCPLVASAMVSGSLSSRTAQSYSYECSACAFVDDNYFVDIFDLSCERED